MKKRNMFVIVLLLLLLGFTIFFFFGWSGKTDLLPTDNNAEDWNGDQKLPSGAKSDSKTIKVPGVSSLVFIADQKGQKVNFYNPKGNDCLFRMTLYIEDKEYWQSGYVNPGKGYYDITLDDTLQSGDYNSALFIECFKEEGTALNSAKVEFNLKVVNE